MTYCFVCECGSKSVECLPASKSTYRPLCACGRKMDRDFAAESPGGHSSQCWPMWSPMGGCHADDVAAYKAKLEQHGVSAEFDRRGSIKWESAGHRKKCCEALGMYDRNGGYGDPRKR